MNEEYVKDFDNWNTHLKSLNENTFEGFFREREIWWCSIGVNIGSEQDGKGEKFSRPVLILKKFNRKLFWAIPLSSKISKGSFFFPLLAESNIFRTALLNQLRLIDSKRLINKIDIISISEYRFITEKITAFLR